MIEVGASATLHLSFHSGGSSSGQGSGNCWGPNSRIWLAIDCECEDECNCEPVPECECGDECECESDENGSVEFYFYNKQTNKLEPRSEVSKMEYDSVGYFTVKATGVSGSWNDIKIRAYGIPSTKCNPEKDHNVGSVGSYGSYSVSGSSSCWGCNGHTHDTCVSEKLVCLTAYRIEIEFAEKPCECLDDDSNGSSSGSCSEPHECSCDSEWREPEEQGTRVVGVDAFGEEIVQRWYVIRADYDNAIRANVEPECLAEMVEESSFAPLGEHEVRDFLPDEDAPSAPVDAQPPWKKLLYGGGDIPVMATIHVSIPDSEESDASQVSYTPVSFSSGSGSVTPTSQTFGTGRADILPGYVPVRIWINMNNAPTGPISFALDNVAGKISDIFKNTGIRIHVTKTTQTAAQLQGNLGMRKPVWYAHYVGFNNNAKGPGGGVASNSPGSPIATIYNPSVDEKSTNHIALYGPNNAIKDWAATYANIVVHEVFWHGLLGRIDKNACDVYGRLPVSSAWVKPDGSTELLEITPGARNAILNKLKR